MNARQRALHAAVVSTSDDQQTQLDLLYEQHFAARYGASSKDVKVVHEHIVGGPVRESAG